MRNDNKKPILVETIPYHAAAKLGLDAGICHKCGKIFIKTNQETLCKECQHPTFPNSFST